MVLTSSLSGNTLQFVNRQFLQDGAYSSGEKEQRDEWTPETEVGNFFLWRCELLSECWSCATVALVHCYFSFPNI